MAGWDSLVIELVFRKGVHFRRKAVIIKRFKKNILWIFSEFSGYLITLDISFYELIIVLLRIIR